MKSITTLLMFFLLFLFVEGVIGIGLSPPQIRINDAPLGVLTKICTVRVSNTDNEPVYVVLKISRLEPNRTNKLRVICLDCKREVGIQRGDLINGSCPFCGSKNLILYDILPIEIMDKLLLKCDENALERTDKQDYYTSSILPLNGFVDVDIYLDVPDEEIYYNNHWEFRLMATSTDNISNKDFIVYGVETKILIDTPLFEKNVETAANDLNIFVFIIIGFSISIVILLVVGFSYRHHHRNKKTVMNETVVKPIQRTNNKPITHQKDSGEDSTGDIRRFLDGL